MKKNPKRRLGYGDKGAREIKTQGFFRVRRRWEWKKEMKKKEKKIKKM